jgi:glutamate-1-semialdehyde 2,1-aminomutase
LTTLSLLSRRGTYEALEKRGQDLQDGFQKVLRKYEICGTINRIGSMMTLFFGIQKVRNADDARKCDRELFARFFHGMLKRGIYMPPSPFEAAFVSLAHTPKDVGRAVRAFDDWAAQTL